MFLGAWIAPCGGAQDKGLDKGKVKKEGVVGATKIRFMEFVYMTQKANMTSWHKSLVATVLDEYVERLNNYIGSERKMLQVALSHNS